MAWPQRTVALSGVPLQLPAKQHDSAVFRTCLVCLTCQGVMPRSSTQQMQPFTTGTIQPPKAMLLAKKVVTAAIAVSHPKSTLTLFTCAVTAGGSPEDA